MVFLLAPNRTMDWAVARSHYGGFRVNLLSVDSIAGAASRCAWDAFDVMNFSPKMRQMCTVTSRMMFEMLSGCELDPDTVDVNMLADSRVPEFGPDPTVLYVSLSSTDRVLDDSDGHRLVVIISGDRARVMQASNSEFWCCSVDEMTDTIRLTPLSCLMRPDDFDLAGFLENSPHASAMNQDQFVGMWTKLVEAAQMPSLVPPTASYAQLAVEALGPAAASSSTSGGSEKGRRMAEAIGVRFDGNTTHSWFVKRSINFGI